MFVIGILLTATGVIGYIFSQDKFLEYGMIALVGIALLMLDKHTPYNEFFKQQSDSTYLINEEAMKKIMFNDKYGLTKAVLKGRKTQTRRIIKDEKLDFAISHFGIESVENISLIKELSVIDSSPVWGIKVKNIVGYVDCISPKYKIGEIIAIAQSYNEIVKEFPHYATKLVGEGITGNEPGCINKMFVRDDLMPHHIRITNVHVERLQDISDEDCLHEGVLQYEASKYHNYESFDYVGNPSLAFDTPGEAFASLIDKISGKGTWKSNPWVFVYEFELID